MEPIVTVNWLVEHLHDPKLIILDASVPSKLAKTQPVSTEMRIPGARFFDFKHTFSDADSHLPNMMPSPKVFTQGVRRLGINKDSKIVVYDNLGIYNSPRAWWMFKTMGHDEVAVLDGGLPAWIDANHPVEPIEEETYDLGNFEAHFRPGFVRDAQYVLDHLNDPNVKVLDARSAGRFTGQTPEPREGMKGGHMPNALNLPYDKVLKDGHFRAKEELKAVFDELEIGEESLTFSCGSGITACVIMLASELVLDNPKAVYDGSWSEWGDQAKDFPVEQ